MNKQFPRNACNILIIQMKLPISLHTCTHPATWTYTAAHPHPVGWLSPTPHPCCLPGRRTMKWGGVVGSRDGSDWNLKHNSIGLALDGWWLGGWWWDCVALPVIGPYIHVGMVCTSIPVRHKRVALKASGSEWASREYLSVSPSKKHWQGLVCGWSPVVALHVLHSLLSSAV